jgi:hypothetical protein
MIRLSLACGCLTLFSLVSAEAQKTTTAQASAANASFAYISDDGCVQNDVVVFANKTTVVSANPPDTKATVTYSRYRYDYCDDSDLGTDMGASAQPVFSGNLDGALLNATINGTTASGSAVSVSIVLVWQGRGATTPLAGRPPNSRAGSPKVIHSENLSRNATVVSGTIDGQDITQGLVSASLRTTLKTTSR